MSGASSDSGSPSLLLPSPIKTGDAVGRETEGLVREVVDGKELERERAILVGVVVGIEVVVVVDGRLEDGERMEEIGVGETTGTNEDESGGADCTDFVESPFQTNWQDFWDKASSTLSQT
jgi:hypothetical protein